MKRAMFFWSLLAGGMVWGAMVLGIRGAEESAEKPAPAGATEKPFPEEPTSPAPEQPPSPTPPAKPTDTFPLDSRQAEAAILKALAEPSEAEFTDAPLKEVIEYWQKRLKIPIALDRKALEDIGVSEDRPVTIHRKGGSFRAILEQVLEPLDLTWTIRHESLWITTPEETENRLVSRVYDVDDLLPPRTEDLWGDLEDLIDVITSTIAPQRWSDLGGPGSINPLIVRGRGFLATRQSWPVHLEIMRLLEDIREAARAHAEERGRPHSSRPRQLGLGLGQPPETPLESAAEQPIEKKPSFVDKVAAHLERSSQAETDLFKALEKGAEAEFAETPLEEIVGFLSDAHRIPILLDRRELASSGSPPDQPVTFQAKDVSLRTLLDRLLEPLDLAWTIRHESIWITTKAKAEELLMTRVYSVEHLLPIGREDAELEEQLERLKEVICNSVSPQSWEDVGGRGSIQTLVVRGNGVLCVCQIWPVHLEIVRLLKEFSQSAGETDRPKAGPPLPSSNGAKPE